MLLVAMWLFLAGYVVALRATDGEQAALVGLLGLVAAWMASLVCAISVGRAGPDQRDVLLASGAVVAFTLGLTAYGAELVVAGEVAFPAVGDIGYLLFYPLMVAALAVAARPAIQPRGPAVLLDVAVIALAVGAVLSVLLDPVLGGDLSLGTAAALSYPLFDLLLVGVLVAVGVLRGWRAVREWGWLVGGLAVFAVTDISFALWFGEGLGPIGSPLQAGWVAGVVLLAMWVERASVPDRRSQAPGSLAAPEHQRAVTVVAATAGGTAAVATVIGLAVLVAATQVRLSTLSVALAGSTMVALGIRTQVAFRQLVRAADLRTLAATDDLTGLPNRRALYAEARSRFTRSSLSPQALLLLDLDRFKEVNDSLGHHLGDRLLVEVSGRLRARLREGDLLARLGGDEFAILLEGARRTEAVAVATSLRAAMMEPFLFEGVSLHSSTSIGIALFPEHGDDLSSLLRKADIALYQAKVTRDRHLVFEGDGAVDAVDTTTRLRRVAELRTALSRKELLLHFQPKVDLRTGQVVGVEALVRWEHPERGLLLPAAFLALVEQSGLMAAMTQEVLRLAIDQAARWHHAGRPLSVAVNLSPSCLVDNELPDQILAMLAAQVVPARALQLEITEEVLMTDRERARGILARLRSRGVQVAVDDFGAGYSSLAYLRDLPVDELKLDRAFVLPMATDPRAAALVASTIDLAHTLDLRIVAEGVEDAETCRELARLGCDQAQGFHVSRPVPAADLDLWLGDGSHHATATAAGPDSCRHPGPHRPVGVVRD